MRKKREIALDMVLHGLAHATRRSIFEQIVKHGEITVADLTRRSDVSQSAVSQHLRCLKQASLITGRQRGRNIHYRATPKGLAPLLNWMSTKSGAY